MTTAEIDGGFVTSTRETITEAGLNASAARVATPETVLMAMYGQGKTRGKVAMLRISAAMNQACAAIEANTRLDSRYLLYYLSSRYREIRSMSNAGSQDNLSGELVRRIPVLIPPIDQQRTIARVLGDSDGLIAALERMLAKKQEIKQGMMQQLLTGKTRLPGFTDPWRTMNLGALGTFLKGRGVKRDDVQRTGIRCIRYGEIYTDFHDYTAEVRSFVSPDVATTALALRTGDLLFAGSGETRHEIGKCVAYIGPTPAVAGGDVIVLRGDQCNSIYLALLANMPEVVSQKAQAGQGDAVVHIYSHALAAVEMTLPPRAEQDAIAQVVFDADREVYLLQDRLTKARNLKQAMMQELLTGRTRLPLEEARHE